MYEAELVKIYDDVFHKLGLSVTIKVNNRKVLSGIAEVSGAAEYFSAMAVAIDKLDKIGVDQVKVEMVASGIDEMAAGKILELLKINSLADLEVHLNTSVIGMRGISELREFHKYFDPIGHKNAVELDLTLARGLSYYTGCIFEVVSNEAKMGSLGGGGRYDDLTSMFGLKDVPGVGISFGAERIYDVMMELDRFNEQAIGGAKAIFLTFDIDSHLLAFQYADKLRSKGIAVDIYPEPAKMKKQMKYADSRAFHYALLIGEDERLQNKVTVKHLKTGDQNLCNIQEVEALLK
jgi:histidyl-tRNA synthetase